MFLTANSGGKRYRRRVRIWLSLILALSVVFVLNPLPASAGGWKLVFQDNFDGNALNRDAWYTRYIYNNGTLDHLHKEKEAYSDHDNHVVSNGILSLVIRKVGDDSQPRPYESGMIRSHQLFHYGYFEARVKLPSGKGLWPAFWLNSDYDKNGRLGWPPEIDIFEYVFNGITEHPDMIHSNVAVSKTNKAQDGTWIYSDPDFHQKFFFYKAPEDLTQDWHTFGLLWDTDDTASVFIDGKQLWKRKYLWVYKDGAEAGPAHIIFNLAIGGGWAGKGGIDDSKIPAALQIDYIRVCQRSDAPDAQPRCGDSPLTPP